MIVCDICGVKVNGECTISLESDFQTLTQLNLKIDLCLDCYKDLKDKIVQYSCEKKLERDYNWKRKTEEADNE